MGRMRWRATWFHLLFPASAEQRKEDKNDALFGRRESGANVNEGEQEEDEKLSDQ